MKRLVQEERSPRNRMRATVRGINGRKKVSEQPKACSANATGQSRQGLGLGWCLLSLLMEKWGSTWLCPALASSPSPQRGV